MRISKGRFGLLMAKLICYYTPSINVVNAHINNVLDNRLVTRNFVVRVACLWKIEVTILIPISDGLSIVITKDQLFQRILL